MERFKWHKSYPLSYSFNEVLTGVYLLSDMQTITCSFCAEPILTFAIKYKEEKFCTHLHRELFRALTEPKRYALKLLNKRLVQSEFAFTA